jgi:Cadherin domain
VTDTNDNSPAFTEAAYSFDIPEDTGRGAFVGAVSVTDLDEGVNAQVSYTVLSDWGNDVFSLNPQSGVFTLTSRLDYEQVSSAPLSLSEMHSSSLINVKHCYKTISCPDGCPILFLIEIDCGKIPCPIAGASCYKWPDWLWRPNQFASSRVIIHRRTTI